MPIDPAGTTPGLTPEPAATPKQLHNRCKRAGCDSIEATEMPAPNSRGQHLYRCTTCNMVHGVTTGGSFEI